MQRVMILGGPGSGKSTLARWLGRRTGLPVQHMDQIHWKPGWVERSRAEKLPLVRGVEARDRWIIEGGLSATYSTRAARADVIIWLDLPVGLRLWRVLRRSWQYRGQTRPDLAPGCPERFDGQTLAFLLWIWRVRRDMRGKVLRLLASQPRDKVVHHLTSPAAVAAFRKAL